MALYIAVITSILVTILLLLLVLLWSCDARRYPTIATTTDNNAMYSNVPTSWSDPLLYWIQYRLGVSHFNANVTTGMKKKRIETEATILSIGKIKRIS